MKRTTRREAALIGSLILAGIALSLLVYFVWYGPGDNTSSPAVRGLGSQVPASLRWETTGDYHVSAKGVVLSIHLLGVRPGFMTMVYSLSGAAGQGELRPKIVVVTDDTGNTYRVVDNVILGTSQGVTLGAVTTEPYRNGGSELTFAVRDVLLTGPDGPSTDLPGQWSLTFARNLEPAPSVDYSFTTRVGPVVQAFEDLDLAMAGGAQLSFVKLLVRRGGQGSAIHGHVSQQGAAERLTAEQFRDMLQKEQQATDLPPPPEW